jgi:hypothetical protein
MIELTHLTYPPGTRMVVIDSVFYVILQISKDMVMIIAHGLFVIHRYLLRFDVINCIVSDSINYSEITRLSNLTRVNLWCSPFLSSTEQTRKTIHALFERFTTDRCIHCIKTTLPQPIAEEVIEQLTWLTFYELKS